MRRNLSPCLGFLTTCLFLFLSAWSAQAKRAQFNPEEWTLLVNRASNNEPNKACTYTLFTGSGNWNDVGRWSHQPPHTKAFALVNGDVEITENINCAGIYVGKGSLSVAPGCKVTVQYLYLCDPTASIGTSGNIEVTGKVLIRHMLPEKGRWYFLASPVDIYSMYENEFTLRDNKTVDSGNYFYMQRYNGERRGDFGQTSGNWAVVPSLAATQPPFLKKGEGYLFALDAAASHKEVILISKSPVSFADLRQGEIVSIEVSVLAGQESSPHQGWYLCGNPLHSPLSLSDIAPNPDLDGNIYVYEAGTYKAYPIGSNYAIPLAGTFFVKARKSTTLVISPSNSVRQLTLLPPYVPVDFARSEPEPVSIPTGHSAVSTDFSRPWFLTAAGIHFEQLPAPRMLAVSDLTGRLLMQRTLPAGATFIPLSLQQGCYILQICSGSDCNQYKFVWNNG